MINLRELMENNIHFITFDRMADVYQAPYQYQTKFDE